MIHAIALDIDGTITFDNRQLDIISVKAIRKAEKSNVRICLATGNILCFVRTSALLLGTTGPLIAEDGGVIYDQDRNEELILGSTEEVDEAIELLERRQGEVQHTDTSRMRHTERTLERTFDSSQATEMFSDKGLNVRAVDSGFAIHVKNLEINKGEALKKVASILGCSLSEIAAIGDGQNDVEMLQSAGLSFVPANACPEAKNASDRVMEKPYGSGVREAINRILKNQE